MASRKSPRRVYSRELPLHRFAKIEIEKNEKLSRKWQEKAEHELDEIPEKTKARIIQLRHMLAVTDTLPHGRRDDAFLLRFLRAKKFDVEKAYRMLLKYFSMKQHSAELFRVSPISQLHELLKMQMQYMLPNRDSNGRQIYIFRVEKCDPYKCPVESVFRSNVLALENAVREPETQIGGIVVLLDMAGAGLGHAKFLVPYLSRKTVEVIQEAFPLRFKAFHILNQPFYFDAILAVLKPFLKEKIRKRIYLHGKSLESLHNHIPKEILPAEYGGTQSNFDNTIWRKSILNDAEYFHHLEWYKNCIWDDEEDEDQSIFDENLSDSGSLNVNAIKQYIEECAFGTK
ncbi:unnamed protein product [Hermetia illucens]|uniref:CRAL-TRIO domain-containing protein n=1 Tax=Hermetia illucens TaxID=343691 RepID=A0A7R8UT22_HERIL|nr:alpha-tocopherol transfer protein-like isoform X1 [Hermetia illucens]CAD7086529.1 unnamed protein product [Hermetia illucens]